MTNDLLTRLLFDFTADIAEMRKDIIEANAQFAVEAADLCATERMRR